MDTDDQKIEQAADVLNAMVEKSHEDEPSAAERLRAFEDKHVGKNAPRIEGKIERGHGSKFGSMSPMCQTAHAALENFVQAEDRLMQATAELAKAKTAHSDTKTKADHAVSLG